MIEVSIIIVNYKSKHYLAACLQSIKQQVKVSYEIILVENNSGEVLDDLKEANITIIYNDQNNGFGSGVNRGAKQAKGDYLFFLNPDTSLLNDAIHPLVYELKKDSRLGIIGGSLMTKDGLIQPYQFSEIPNFKSIMRSNITRFKPFLIPENSLVQVGYVSGGAMMIRKDLFKELHGFDEAFFMYFEDADLCRRAQQKGYIVKWSKQSQIFHVEGGTESVRYKTKQRYYFSQAYYINKYEGAFKSVLVRIIHKFILLKLSLTS